MTNRTLWRSSPSRAFPRSAFANARASRFSPADVDFGPRFCGSLAHRSACSTIRYRQGPVDEFSAQVDLHRPDHHQAASTVHDHRHLQSVCPMGT